MKLLSFNVALLAEHPSFSQDYPDRPVRLLVELKDRYASIGTDIAGGTSAKFAAYIKTEFEKMGKSGKNFGSQSGMNHRIFIKLLSIMALALCTALTCSRIAKAQSYPAKPIRLIVPLAPGGGNDTLARYVAKYLTESLGQSVVVENRSGGGGLAGGEYAARSTPDGYTLIVAGSGLIVVTLTHKQLNFQRDFTPIANIGEYSALLVTHPSLPVKNVRELIKLAQSRPGQLNFASAGNGSAGHLVMEMFRNAAQIDVVHIPYKGAGPAATEVMAGQVSLLFNNPLGSMPHVKAGRLRALAGSGARRIKAMPDVPTIAESGLPGFDATFFLGLLGPLALPRDIVTKLNAETVKITQRRDIQDALALQGMEAISSTPDEFAARIKSEMEKTAKVVRESGMRLN